MDSREIVDLLRDVFGRSIKVEIAPQWVNFSCPLSPWTHERGRDRSPSAGLSISPGGVSLFHCFTCKNTGPAHSMLRKYAQYSGEDLSSLVGELEEEAYFGPRELPSWEDRWEAPGRKELQVLDQDVFLGLYESAEGHPYLAERGISDSTARKLGLMVDPSDPEDGEERVLFPVFGPTGTLHGLTGRAVSGSARLKVRDYYGLAKSRCLLGSHLIGQEHDKVALVEGLFDYANAWECGIPAVAAMHSSLTPDQEEILLELDKPVYLFFDNDRAGQEGAEKAGARLCRNLPVLRVQYPRVWIGDERDGHWLKDPGELTREEFLAMVADPRLY
jgi:hypothetical protein